MISLYMFQFLYTHLHLQVMLPTPSLSLCNMAAAPPFSNLKPFKVGFYLYGWDPNGKGIES